MFNYVIFASGRNDKGSSVGKFVVLDRFLMNQVLVDSRKTGVFW